MVKIYGHGPNLNSNTIFKHPVALLYFTHSIIISVTMQPRKTYFYILFSLRHLAGMGWICP
jgi:hypothetical protein